MLIEYKKALEKAVCDQKINKKMLGSLKRRNLDKIFQRYHTEIFEEVDCLVCANCCITTGPLLLERDIGRIAKYLNKKPSALTREYLKKDEDYDWVFKILPCPFLDSDNYCLIYDVRPKACREYPHTDSKYIHQIFGKTLINSTICPAVSMILERIRGE